MSYLAVYVTLVLVLVNTARGQDCLPPVFSIDELSATIGTPDSSAHCGAKLITEGDVLSNGLSAQTCGSGFTPFARLCEIDLGMVPGVGCVPAPGMGCDVELDALSVGQDELPPDPEGGSFRFTVDRAAEGVLVGNPFYPTVLTEGAGPGSAGEASADMFVDLGIPALTGTPPLDLALVSPVGNVGVMDGDGCVSSSGFFYPGLGLSEADDLDALESDIIDITTCGVYWSLSNASALAHSPYPGIGDIHGADILFTLNTGSPAVSRHLTAGSLGLDLGGPYTDDIDALALTEPLLCGAPPFPPVPVLFSVTPGSMVVGQTDSLFGLPISPGDILTLPANLNARPSIWVPAEILGLRTARTDGASDNLDGLMVTSLLACDCNSNGVEDAVDVAKGSSFDCNRNGVPDECDGFGPSNYCTAGTTASGCNALLSASGHPSATASTGFFLTANGVEGGVSGGLFYFGTNGQQANPWGNPLFGCTSYQCVAAPVTRDAILAGTGTSGSCDGTYATDLNARWTAMPAQKPPVGATVNAQFWFRDPNSPCQGLPAPAATSLSDAITFIVCP